MECGEEILALVAGGVGQEGLQGGEGSGLVARVAHDLVRNQDDRVRALGPGCVAELQGQVIASADNFDGRDARRSGPCGGLDGLGCAGGDSFMRTDCGGDQSSVADGALRLSGDRRRAVALRRSAAAGPQRPVSGGSNLASSVSTSTLIVPW